MKYSVGDTPLAITSTDFDGDGFLDLAVANAASDSVTILINRGNNQPGRFQRLSDIAVGDGSTAEGPVALLATDLNDDGLPDLATLNLHSATISLLFQQGGGHGFLPPLQIGLSTYQNANDTAVHPRGLVASDLTGDGLVDLAVVGDLDISLLLNGRDANGFAGVFAPPRQLADTFDGISPIGRANYPQAEHFQIPYHQPVLVTADFDADRRPDLAYVGGTMDYVFGAQKIALFSPQWAHDVVINFGRTATGIDFGHRINGLLTGPSGESWSAPMTSSGVAAPGATRDPAPSSLAPSQDADHALNPSSTNPLPTFQPLADVDPPSRPQRSAGARTGVREVPAEAPDDVLPTGAAADQAIQAAFSDPTQFASPHTLESLEIYLDDLLMDLTGGQ